MDRHHSPIWKAIITSFFWIFPVTCTFAQSSSCVQGDDPFILGLPQAHKLPWVQIRELIARGELEEADSLIGNAPTTSEAWLWKGVLLLQQHQTFASIRALEKSAKISEGSVVETLLATDYLLLNQRILAQEALDRAMKLNSENPQALYVLGRLHFIKNDFIQARTEFLAALKLEPNDYHSLYHLGLCEWRLGRSADAQRVLLQALDRLKCYRANFPFLPLDLARLELELGKKPEALIHANLALQTASQQKSDDQQVASILALRGKVLLALGRRGEAESDWQRALTLCSTCAESWYLLARSYQARGETTLAANALAEFRKIKDEL